MAHGVLNFVTDLILLWPCSILYCTHLREFVLIKKDGCGFDLVLIDLLVHACMLSSLLTSYGIDRSMRFSWFHISSSIMHVMSDLHSYNKDLKFLLKSCFHGLSHVLTLHVHL